MLKNWKTVKKLRFQKIKDISTDKIDRIRNSTIGTAEERQAAMNRINEIVLETIKDINNAQTPQQVEAALNNGIARILAVQIVTSDHSKPSSNSDGQSNSHLHVGYGTVNHPFNSSPIGHKKKLIKMMKSIHFICVISVTELVMLSKTHLALLVFLDYLLASGSSLRNVVVKRMKRKNWKLEIIAKTRRKVQ